MSFRNPLQAIADELLLATSAGRTTIRCDVPGDFFPIVAEALTAGARTFRDYSMAWVARSPTPIYDVLSRERKMLIQSDVFTDERPPPRDIVEKYGVRAQMVAPVLLDDDLAAIVAVHELRGPRQWTPQDIASLEAAVDQVGTVLRSQR